ncbi:chloramphenicol-biosynthetic FADH2-dependent halogenase CmlS [Streptomyces sp. DSM 42041]|uniref:Chloramphenicol-biosynthetic FADH2-dependent halogenase CmlS n=1 Tax=Streptomyces hazeniae TaxID=3075538 RepID=A0ABU2NW81_9ACTN|nr:chloramphenicol-biosynthetic FADH2-dependent halogenase CmlS [Streptomyces sp. DSM 42041]MDT0380965.1 chloramphenicol-biosynthetic FADH2-dependent halogenase CmlS [Streptomyces sp. DSM 42041]
MARSKVSIIGGGPAGCVAALTLQKLGHDVAVYERTRFPRYRIGESLLPGTMSILNRLGLQERIDAQNYVKKPSATFLWGQDQAPWTFSFAAPKVAPWVFDHAIQVKRDEFDQLLLDEARARGVTVVEEATVTDVDLSRPEGVALTVRQGDETTTVEGDFVIDAGGSGGPLVRKLGVRRYDEFYKNFAVWSYFTMEDPFKGDLKGTTYSITFEDGWVWMIPVKDDLYSVGLVVDRSKSAEVREMGADEFYRSTLAKCTQATELLAGADQADEVRIVHDWSYDTEVFSADRYFLCGDAACFTDPLFSQGVHLASQSAVSAAAAIDRITRNEEERDAVHAWYNRTYREAYEQYHQFLASFYTFASFTEPDSEFWRKRRITESDDDRLSRRQWFEKLTGDGQEESGTSVADFRDRASTMISIGKHQRPELSDDFSEDELNAARVRWISDLTKRLNRITRFRWTGGKVLLKPHYRVEPLSFRLEQREILSNQEGLDMAQYSMDEEVRQVFQDLAEEEFGYKALVKRLGRVGKQELTTQIVLRLMEAGLLTGYDKNGDQVVVQGRLHFGGVGVEYEV